MEQNRQEEETKLKKVINFFKEIEPIAVIIIGVCSIVIASNSINLQKNNQKMKIQEQQPYFTIEEKNEEDPKDNDKFLANRNVEVNLEKGVAESLKFYNISFLKVIYSDPKDYQEYIKYLPLSYFFGASHTGIKGKDKVKYVLSGYQNNRKYTHLYREAPNKNLDVEIYNFIKIVYYDIYKNRQERYFNTENGNNLFADEGKYYFDLRTKAYRKLLNLNSPKYIKSSDNFDDKNFTDFLIEYAKSDLGIEKEVFEKYY